MFPKVDITASVEFHDGLKTALIVYQRTTLVIEMDHFGIRQIINFPASIPDALTIISINVIKHAFVKIANLLDHFLTDHSRSTRDIACLKGFARIVTQVQEFLAREMVPGEEFSDCGSGSEQP
jgi:hypothetical protein